MIQDIDAYKEYFYLNYYEMRDEEEWRMRQLDISETAVRRLRSDIICYSNGTSVRKVTKPIARMIERAECKFGKEIYHCIKSQTPRGVYYYLIYSSFLSYDCYLERRSMRFGILPAIIVNSKNEMIKSTICAASKNGVLYRTDELKYKKAE